MRPLRLPPFAACSFVALLSTPAFAAVSIDYVTVGNAGNAADATGYGAVAYEYRIAKNETTIGQYAEFLNAAAKSDPYGLYNADIVTYHYVNGISRSGESGSYTYAVNPGSANKPVTFVSWFDAARFVNWLHNGQGNGSTETGAYNLNGAMSGTFAVQPGATVWIPTQNEWYKAAYYDPTKNDGAGGYWLYPTQRDTLTSHTPGVPGAANFFHNNNFAVFTGVGTWTLTDVGAYGAGSASYYGTNDQGGNVSEWNSSISGTSPGIRGGSYDYYSPGQLISTSGGLIYTPTREHDYVGFRVASAIPEPAAAALLMQAAAAAFCLLARRQRRA